MISPKQSIWHRYRKWWIIGGSCLSLLVIGGVAAWNILAWQDYERKYVTWKAAAYTRADEALALPAKTTGDRDKKRRSFVALQKSIEADGGICQSYQILHWQRFIPQVKDQLERCSGVARKLTELAGDIAKVTAYLEAEQAMIKILAKGAATKLDEAAWKQQPQTWVEIEKELRMLNVPTVFGEVYNMGISKSQSVQEAWRALTVANETKDRAKYEEATAKLAAAYDTFGEIANLSEKTFPPLVTAFEVSYRRAFR